MIVTGRDVSLRQLADQLPTVATLRPEGPWSGLQLTGEHRELYLMHDRRSLWRARRSAPQDNWCNYEVIWKAPPDQFAVRWSVSPDNQLLALNLENEQPRSHRLQCYRIGATAPYVDVTTNLINAMQFSPDSRYLAAVRNDDIQLWDVEKGQLLYTLSHHGDSIRDLAFSPDGRCLASVSNDRHVAVWDAHDGQLLWWATAHENRAQAVAFHPWLPTLVTAGADAMLHFWRLDTRDEPGETRLVGKFPLDTASPIKVCAAK